MATEVKKISWWHERLADWMVTNPDKTMKDAAVYFNCSAGWLSVLKNSDTFKAYWAGRSADASEKILGDIVAKTGAVAEMALDKLLVKLESPNEVLPAPFLLQAMDTSLKRLGYGAPAAVAAGVQANVTVNIGTVSSEALASARQKLRTLHGVEEVQAVTEVSPLKSLTPPRLLE